MKTAVYPGSFDPVTNGHVDVATRASRLFERLYVAVSNNTSKQALLNPENRLQLVKDSVGHLPNVEVESFEGLTVEYARQKGAEFIVRGLRAVSDFEYECMMSQMNKQLGPEIETVFMMADLEYQFLSSSLVKEVVRLGGDVSALVPAPVSEYLQRRRAS